MINPELIQDVIDRVHHEAFLEELIQLLDKYQPRQSHCRELPIIHEPVIGASGWQPEFKEKV